ncbi:lactoylglutathione lyase [Sharpea azabuensis]|uniref:Aldoketomutase n=1 Tax=Sharpea porci TaxID=2652286 RepID=A0A844FWG2_9FIRM|nr:VOC family protein [Sharpea porci]MDD6710986.1 VOC family protein [Sharpea porci]MDY5278294.1 VOC family protein [Sharpea porci]MST89935.1 lactoylglutathione lyase [Sharpea porci]
MKGHVIHCNINVTNLEKSLAFYKEALGLEEKRRKVASDGSFILVYIGNDLDDFEIELTWLKDHPQAYELGENESHIAFEVEDMQKAHAHHEQMGCICFENPAMGIYFIHDPDDYWLEVLPKK